MSDTCCLQMRDVMVRKFYDVLATHVRSLPFGPEKLNLVRELTLIDTVFLDLFLEVVGAASDASGNDPHPE